MRLGLHLPQFSGSPRDLAWVARFAEGSGYSTIWVSEHLLTPHAGGAIPPVEIMDPLVTLGYVAALTTKIRLATSVIVVPYHHPGSPRQGTGDARPPVRRTAGCRPRQRLA